MNGYGYVDSVLYIYSMVIGRDAHWDGAYLANLLVVMDIANNLRLSRSLPFFPTIFILFF